MKQDKNIEITGVITKSLPNTTFKVQVDEDSINDYAGKEILCTLAGKMRLYRIRVMPGDKVKVLMTPYDKNRGRIVYREK